MDFNLLISRFVVLFPLIRTLNLRPISVYDLKSNRNWFIYLINIYSTYRRKIKRIENRVSWYLYNCKTCRYWREKSVYCLTRLPVREWGVGPVIELRSTFIIQLTFIVFTDSWDSCTLSFWYMIFSNLGILISILSDLVKINIVAGGHCTFVST